MAYTCDNCDHVRAEEGTGGVLCQPCRDSFEHGLAAALDRRIPGTVESAPVSTDNYGHHEPWCETVTGLPRRPCNCQPMAAEHTESRDYSPGIDYRGPTQAAAPRLVAVPCRECRDRAHLSHCDRWQLEGPEVDDEGRMPRELAVMLAAAPQMLDALGEAANHIESLVENYATGPVMTLSVSQINALDSRLFQMHKALNAAGTGKTVRS